MEVVVRFIGIFRVVSGRSRLALDLGRKHSDVSEAMDRISEELPQFKKVFIDSDLEDPRPNALVLLNGREISVLDGLETVLRDGDEIVLVPVSHGG